MSYLCPSENSLYCLSDPWSVLAGEDRAGDHRASCTQAGTEVSLMLKVWWFRELSGSAFLQEGGSFQMKSI